MSIFIGWVDVFNLVLSSYFTIIEHSKCFKNLVSKYDNIKIIILKSVTKVIKEKKNEMEIG